MRFTKAFGLLLTLIIPMSVQAQTNVSPNLSSGVAGWTTDRYNPANFNTANGVQGRNDVLQVGINSTTDLANRPGPYQSTFYNTQGKKLALSQSGSWSYTMDLFVDNSWSNPSNGYVRTDMWVTGVDASNAVSAYGILGFTNFGGAAQFRGWDSNLGTWTSGGTVNFGSWNTLGMQFDVSTGTYSYYANGLLFSSFVDVASVGISDLMIQAYNFNDPAILGSQFSPNPAYTANWSNTSTVPEPSTYVLMASGLAGVLFMRNRRKHVEMTPQA